MIRHRYGIDPATGKPGHFKIDCGRAEVARLRGTQLTPRTAKTGMGNFGRKITGRGAA